MATSHWQNGRSYTGPTLEDCQKCFDTIRRELVNDFQIRLEFQELKNPSYISRLVGWSPGLDPETGAVNEHVWATKELQAGYEAITYRQLYDLLILSYRQIDAHLGGQIPLLLS